jgi:tRNA threonylcarbamoyladenosine biosynthesis protein TsaE
MIVSEDKLYLVVDDLKSKISSKNIVVLLQGTLASGKTTFVKQFVKSLGYKDKVTSPTFSLQSIYGNDIFHYDIYNKTLEQFIALGLLEEFEKDGIHFVEWGDEELKTILKDFGFDVLTIQIDKKNDKREYKISV